MTAHKTLKIIAAFLIATFMSLATALGSTGQAVIPLLDWGYVDTNNRGHTSIYLSNVTNGTVTVTVSLFNNTGALITDSDNLPSSGILKMSGSFSNYQEAPTTGGSLEFTLAANQSATILVYEGVAVSGATGYGRIEWWQSGNNTSALISHAKNYYKNSGIWSFCAIPINCGLPY